MLNEKHLLFFFFGYCTQDVGRRFGTQEMTSQHLGINQLVKVVNSPRVLRSILDAVLVPSL